jgi:hypothetical protein
MNRDSLILTIILIALAIWLGSELKSYLPELLKVEKVEKYEFSLSVRRER